MPPENEDHDHHEGSPASPVDSVTDPVVEPEAPITEKLKIKDVVTFEDEDGKLQKGKIKKINEKKKSAVVVVGTDEYVTDTEKLTKINLDEPQKKEKLFKVIFRENRTHELFVAGEKLIWGPNSVNPIFPEKYNKGLPERLINDRDFKSQESYFTIVEVK